jgi:cytoskeletal protein CcmA (bactofilin family)
LLAGGRRGVKIVAVRSDIRGSVQESQVSYFSGSKSDGKPNGAATMDASRSPGNSGEVSTIGSGMQVTGNIICAGTLQVHGSVTGDIHAVALSICEGARVEGKVLAPDAVIEGQFTGTIHSNNIKLQKTAVVEGEIHNKSLAIEEAARFEGVSRRLERAVEGPGANIVPLERINAHLATPAE